MDIARRRYWTNAVRQKELQGLTNSPEALAGTAAGDARHLESSPLFR
jgi:hypothetical protein